MHVKLSAVTLELTLASFGSYFASSPLCVIACPNASTLAPGIDYAPTCDQPHVHGCGVVIDSDKHRATGDRASNHGHAKRGECLPWYLMTLAARLSVLFEPASAPSSVLDHGKLWLVVIASQPIFGPRSSPIQSMEVSPSRPRVALVHLVAA
ncbi:hypothetical protein BDV96DRAFT_567552 [Lophiotrema nucula]|uniref:Secreted protein n=1 Tax=Lophiotrema nucula TaxID=690887 RepID=A0A6A5ZLW6_9PLEO|nr:hypothetical protein BDV96DRAFT_567552 [Lophiotrema nucula]